MCTQRSRRPHYSYNEWIEAGNERGRLLPLYRFTDRQIGPVFESTEQNDIMPKSIIRRWLPTPEQVRANNGLKFLGTLLHDPNLFHLNRHSVSVGFAVGIFTSFLPLPGQMLIAALLALWFRCNLPLSMALVWISNPVTMPAIFYSTYKLGAWLLGTPHVPFKIELSWEWLTEEVGRIWLPLFSGSLICGIFFATVAYFTMQAIWRWQVVKRWKARLELRKSQLNQDS